jgi:hypothetical protein
MRRSSPVRYRRFRAALRVLAGICVFYLALAAADIIARSIGWKPVLVLVFGAGIVAGCRTMSCARRPRTRR